MVPRAITVGVCVLLAFSQALAQPGGGGGGMGGGGGGGMGGGGVIDPPIGPAFSDPVEMGNQSQEPGVVEVDLHAQLADINVNGATASLMTYNGHFPAPTIRINQGDLLKVHLTNDLPYTTETNFLGFQKNLTNLHMHGFHVSPQPPADFVMYALQHGETHDHEYNTSLHPGGTMTLYHPHKHGLVGEQFWAGLLGTVITADPTDALAGYETHILVLTSTWPPVTPKRIIG